MDYNKIWECELDWAGSGWGPISVSYEHGNELRVPQKGGRFLLAERQSVSAGLFHAVATRAFKMGTQPSFPNFWLALDFDKHVPEKLINVAQTDVKYAKKSKYIPSQVLKKVKPSYAYV